MRQLKVKCLVFKFSFEPSVHNSWAQEADLRGLLGSTNAPVATLPPHYGPGQFILF